MKRNASKKAPTRSALERHETVRGDPVKSPNIIALNKQRTTLDFSAQTAGEIDQLMSLTGSDSMSDVMRSSLTLFSALDKMEARGASLFIRDGDGANSLFIPSLRAVNGLLRSSCGTKKRRVTIELNARANHALKSLQESTGETKKSDVIRQAIHLQWTLLNEVEKGRKVVIREEDNREYDMFEFDQGASTLEPDNHDDSAENEENRKVAER